MDSDSSVEVLEVRRPPGAWAVPLGELFLAPSASTDDDDADPVEIIMVDDSDDDGAVPAAAAAPDEDNGENTNNANNNTLAHLDEIDLPDYCANESPDSLSTAVGDDRDLDLAIGMEWQTASGDESNHREEGNQCKEEEMKDLSLGQESREEFVKQLNRQLYKDRRDLTNARMDRLATLLDMAQKKKTPPRPAGLLLKLPYTYDPDGTVKQPGRTFFSFTRNLKRDGWGVSHPFKKLDSTPVSVIEDQMPKNVARVLLDTPFANLSHLAQEEGKLKFVSSRFDEEVKTEEEIAEFRKMFDMKPRELAIRKGPLYRREEADKLVKRALVFWSTSKLFRSANLDQLTQTMLQVFSPRKYYEPDLVLKVQKYYADPASASEAVFAAPEPDATCEPVVETTHDTLEGDDPDYLKAIDTFRNLYCVRCKMFLCNLHSEYEPGSLQIQYESAIAEERARSHGRVTHHLPPPDDRDKLIPTRKSLTSFHKAICRRLFLIYEGDVRQVAQFLNVEQNLVQDFCRDFKLPTKSMFVKQLATPKNMQQWYSTRCYPTKLYMTNSQTPGHERNAFFPCYHDGPCENPDSNCTCVQNGNFCTIDCVRGKNSRNFFRGCNCKGPCLTSCTCHKAQRECDPLLCSCTGCHDEAGAPTTTQLCQNDNITMKRRRLTYVGISEIPNAGFGLFSRYNIKKNEYIDEYVGEIISHDEAQRRGVIYDGEKNTSLFQICQDLYMDASNMCNHMRFINFSSTPNTQTRNVSVRGESRIGFFALKDIPAQTELTLNYNFQEGKHVADGVPGFLPQESKKSGSSKGKKSKRKGNPKKRKGPP